MPAPATGEFRLPDATLAPYRYLPPDWGFNGLGEFIFYRTYSRLLPDGSKEAWLDVVRRVVEGTYELIRRHAQRTGLGWDRGEQVAEALEMFDRIYRFKFLPPGRGLWVMGTPVITERRLGAAANNCGFCSTDPRLNDHPSDPFCFLMDASMLGVGIGF